MKDDAAFDSALRQHISQVAAGLPASTTSSLFVETAGGECGFHKTPHNAKSALFAGVNSPTLSGTTQAEAYRSLRLPAILVASPHLGGISTTISAYESLLLRGYTVEAVLCMQDSTYENWRYLEKFFRKQDSRISFADFPKPPEMTDHDHSRDAQNMLAYYDSQHMVDAFGLTVEHLHASHLERLNQLDVAGQDTLDHIWWPFTQQAHFKKSSDVMVIDSALKDSFTTYGDSTSENKNLLQSTFDGSASWWTQCLGHARYELNLAAAHATGRYGHVIFPGATHSPALDLAKRLVRTVGQGWASKAFFSDNGSTGMEVWRLFAVI